MQAVSQSNIECRAWHGRLFREDKQQDHALEVMDDGAMQPGSLTYAIVEANRSVTVFGKFSEEVISSKSGFQDDPRTLHITAYFRHEHW
jgi:hypothetical protein